MGTQLRVLSESYQMKTNMIVWMVFRPLRPSALDESRLALEGLMVSGVSRLWNLQCRLLISALIAWAARAEYTSPHARPPPPPPIFVGMDVYMTSQPIIALIRKLRVSSMYFAYFLTCHSWVCVQPGTARRPVD